MNSYNSERERQVHAGYFFYLSIELDVLINSIAKAWTAKSCNWIKTA